VIVDDDAASVLLVNEPLYLPGRAGPTTSRPPAALLLCDRDGTVIHNRENYVRTWSDVEFIPGAVAALRTLAASGCPIVLVSNQSPVGRGLLTVGQVVDVHEQVVRDLADAGVPVLGSYLCPHAPVDGCACRKPRAGMLLDAVRRFRSDPARTVMVGDAVEDMLAAHAAGIRGLMVATGRGARHSRRLAQDSRTRDTQVVADLAAAVDLFLGGGTR